MNRRCDTEHHYFFWITRLFLFLFLTSVPLMLIYTLDTAFYTDRVRAQADDCAPTPVVDIDPIKKDYVDMYGWICTSGCGVVKANVDQGGAVPAVGSGWTDPKTGIDYKVFGDNGDGTFDVGPDTSEPFEGGGIGMTAP